MKLAIIDYIKTHENWRELLSMSPYNLRINTQGKYAVLTYLPGADFSEKICCEARGLIIDTETYKVVRMAFEKFFNIDEPFAATIDWSTAKASEKIDGSIMSVWYADGEWHVSTNSVIDARNARVCYNIRIASNITFYDVFMKAAKNSGLDFDKLNKNYCYTFELTSPETRVIIVYNECKLYHLLTRDMTTLEEVNEDIGVEKPKLYALQSEEDIRNTVSQFDESHEGVVVVDANGNRVKIKTEKYFTMHKSLTGFNFEKAVELVLNDDYYEFLSYFKQYTEYFEAISAVVEQIKEDALRLEERVSYLYRCYSRLYVPAKSVEDVLRKRFVNAFSHLDSKTFARAMLAYDLSLLHVINNPLTVQQYIEFTKEYWLKLKDAFPEFISDKDLV